MGVNGLWSLLAEKEKKVDLSKCGAKKLAVDLSCWIVSTPHKYIRGSGEDILPCRSLFFRITELLSFGITPIFVMDSPIATILKGRQRGEIFFQEMKEYEKLLKALGLPVLQSPGEAEKMCADLDRRQIVDGCLTDDGDAFLYGARTVYKRYRKGQKYTQTYEMAEIESKESNLCLSHEDLVAFALLSGSDMCKGVKGVGEANFRKLVLELHKNDIYDILERFQSWQNNEELELLDQKSNDLKTKSKGTHCSQCSHKGTISKHKKNGCDVCETQVGCGMEGASDTNENIVCPCPYHVLEASVKPFKTELEIRKLALKDINFPSQKVIKEYLDPTDLEEASIPTFQMPKFHEVCQILHEKLKFDNEKTLSYLIPAIINAHLQGLLPDFALGSSPEILKAKIKGGEKFYVVKWPPLAALEEFEIDGRAYECECDVLQDIFKSKFGEIAQDFEAKKSEGTSANKREKKKKLSEELKQQNSLDLNESKKSEATSVTEKKRKQDKKLSEDRKQPKITDIFKQKKNIQGEMDATVRGKS